MAQVLFQNDLCEKWGVKNSKGTLLNSTIFYRYSDNMMFYLYFDSNIIKFIWVFP